METTINIRPYESSDHTALATLTTELGYPTSPDQMFHRMHTMSRQESYRTFVAIQGQKVIGYAGVSKQSYWEKDGCFLRIQALVVSHEYRRSGVGKLLVEAAEKHAKSTGANAVLLNCGNREEREGAHHFYKRMGFEPKSTGYVKNVSV